jgi:phosphoribosyl 1,2-cyclic phosphodiesterase
MSALRFYLVDDDDPLRQLYTRFLTDAGHQAIGSSSAEAAFSEIIANPPDCVITDLMMPEVDGFELCKRLRSIEALQPMKIVVASSKGFEFDRRRAREFGANGYLTKGISRTDFVKRLEAIVADKIEVGFHGVRGTLPAPGPETVRYGGNTSCVTLALERKLMASRQRLTGKIFITHPHWDHINALPFFTPLYITGNEFEILGPAQAGMTMQDMISAQMDGVFFPITIREFGARVMFRDLREQTFEVEGVQVDAMLLNHPGVCLGYRFHYGGRSVCYITDNELPLESMPQFDRHYQDRLVSFVRDTDLLITDSNYTDEVYPQRVGWGHSAVGPVVDLAHEAGVKHLALFHHDPDQTDDDIDRKLAFAQERLAGLGSSTVCVAPAEGSNVMI